MSAPEPSLTPLFVYRLPHLVPVPTLGLNGWIRSALTCGVGTPRTRGVMLHLLGLAVTDNIRRSYANGDILARRENRPKRMKQGRYVYTMVILV